MKRDCFLIPLISLLLVLCSCGPFGAGPWYMIFEGTTTEDDEDVGTVFITSGPTVAQLTNNSATIEWNTDVPSDSTVQYGPDTSYGLQQSDSVFDTFHSVTITGLSSGTTYHCCAVSRSVTGGIGVSADVEFTTCFALSISSAYGPTTPGTGTWYYASGEEVLARAPESISGPSKRRTIRSSLAWLISGVACDCLIRLIRYSW